MNEQNRENVDEMSEAKAVAEAEMLQHCTCSCGNQVKEEHASDEPHTITLCGACAN